MPKKKKAKHNPDYRMMRVRDDCFQRIKKLQIYLQENNQSETFGSIERVLLYLLQNYDFTASKRDDFIADIETIGRGIEREKHTKKQIKELQESSERLSVWVTATLAECLSVQRMLSDLKTGGQQ